MTKYSPLGLWNCGKPGNFQCQTKVFLGVSCLISGEYRPLCSNVKHKFSKVLHTYQFVDNTCNISIIDTLSDVTQDSSQNSWR